MVAHRFRSVRWRLRKVIAGAGAAGTATRLRLALAYYARVPHDPDFRFFAHLNGEPGLFVDGGANSGQSALSFRIFNRTFRILSFEANPLLGRDLAWVRRLLGPTFSYRMVGLSSTSSERVLHVPAVDGVAITGEATFDGRLLLDDPGTRRRIAEFSGTETPVVREVPSSVVRLDDLGLAPQAIKLDLQGHERDAIKGMLGTISTSRPIVMVENNLWIGEIRELLRAHGYRGYVYDPDADRLEDAGDVPRTVNVFFLTEAHRGRLVRPRP